MAACELLEEVGEEGISTRGVAARAGVSPGIIHHHFGSKEGLLDACVETMYTDVEVASADWVLRYSQHNDLDRAVEEVVRGGYQIAKRHRAIMRVLLRRVASHGQLDEARIEYLQRPALALVITLLAKHSRLTPSQIRLHFSAMVFLATRFAISGPEEREAFLPGQNGKHDQVIESYLVSTAKAGLR